MLQKYDRDAGTRGDLKFKRLGSSGKNLPNTVLSWKTQSRYGLGLQLECLSFIMGFSVS